jgi:hypothetical protein
MNCSFRYIYQISIVSLAMATFLGCSTTTKEEPIFEMLDASKTGIELHVLL